RSLLAKGGKLWRHELDRKPVEQVRMARRLTVEPEIEDRRHQWTSKVPHPDMVDRYTGCQGILTISDPAGQGQAPASAGRGVNWTEAGVVFERLIERVARCIAGLCRGVESRIGIGDRLFRLVVFGIGKGTRRRQLLFGGQEVLLGSQQGMPAFGTA